MIKKYNKLKKNEISYIIILHQNGIYILKTINSFLFILKVEFLVENISNK